MSHKRHDDPEDGGAVYTGADFAKLERECHAYQRSADMRAEVDRRMRKHVWPILAPILGFGAGAALGHIFLAGWSQDTWFVSFVLAFAAWLLVTQPE